MPASRWGNAYLRLRLQREIAAGEKTYEQLAEEFDVTDDTISAFAKRYRDAIELIRQDFANEFAGLWIARKEARLAEFQQDVEDINEAVEAGDEEDWTKLLRVKHTALRYVAEELGHLPGRPQIHVEQAKVTYVVEGVDLSLLHTVPGKDTMQS
jgi:hypothetical protein